MSTILILNNVIGSVNDEVFSEQLHSLSHEDKIEYIKLDPTDLARKKFKAQTTSGRSCAVSLSRDAVLENGSILCIENDFAIVLKTNEQKWLKIKPKNINVAIELGYFAGNMHWKVKFADSYLCIALNSPKENYLERLRDFIDNQSINIIDND